MLEGVLATVLNRFLAAYVDGLNTNQLNVGIWSGDVKLRNLRLKRSALDKLRLPIDVKEGYLGQLTLSIPWSNLKGKPVRVLVENVSLLAAPRDASVAIDEAEEDERCQAVKQQKLAQAELLTAGVAEAEEDSQKTESFISSLVTRIVDNVQVTVRNIHIRYEDCLSDPAHPFSMGITLAELSAVSTDENWEPTFVHNSSSGIHKLARLDSLSIYWNTDAEFLTCSSSEDLQSALNELIPTKDDIPSHQYIMEPVSGVGKLIMRHHATKEVPKLDVQLVLDQIGFTLNDQQYRNGLSMANLFSFYGRQAQYQRFRPTEAQLSENRPRALLCFAGQAILNEVHQRRRVWTWAFMKERRDLRLKYIELFKANGGKPPVPANESGSTAKDESLRSLERQLGYRDIRFYRSLARREMRRNKLKAAEEQEQAPQKTSASSSGWLGWIWGSGTSNASNGETSLNTEQRKELYDAIEWDEETGSSNLPTLDDLPPEAVTMHITAKLQTGFFHLQDHRSEKNIVALVFDGLQGQVNTRANNFDMSVTLDDMHVEDELSYATQFRDIVRVKNRDESDEPVPLFFLQFEHHPIDGRADNALQLRMQSMEIVYHASYVESIVQFFRPPETELEVIGALMDVASSTLEGLRRETRAGLENALENHKTIDVSLDIQSPIWILPEDLESRDCHLLVLDAGHLAVRSLLADPDTMDVIRAKHFRQYTEEDYHQLEELMYDRYFIKLEAVQLVLGQGYDACMESIAAPEVQGMHLLERINLSFTLHSSILPRAPNLTKCKLSGTLPLLRIHFSDKKYRLLLQLILSAIPTISDGAKAEDPVDKRARRPRMVDYNEHDDAELLADGTDSDNDEEQFEDPQVQAPEALSEQQKIFEFEMLVEQVSGTVSKSNAEEGDQLLAEAVFQQFRLGVYVFKNKLQVDVRLGSLDLVDCMVKQDPMFRHMITSRCLETADHENVAHEEAHDLVFVQYLMVSSQSPELHDKYEGIESSILVNLSTINVMITRESVLTVYDWILQTFTSAGAEPAPEPEKLEPKPDEDAVSKTSKMRIKIKLSSILLRLNDDGELLSSLELSTADIALLLRENSMRIAARIGSLSLRDEKPRQRIDASLANLLSIEGDELVDFALETFDAHDEQYPGYDTSIWLRCNTLKLVYMAEPFADMVAYFAKFAKLKAVYDVAKNAASAQASQLQSSQGLTKYDVLVRSPIVVIPYDMSSRNRMTGHLGELYAHNHFSKQADKLESTLQAGLRQIHLESAIESQDQLHELSMLDNVDIELQMLDHMPPKDSEEPLRTTRFSASMSDVNMALTQQQYMLLMHVLCGFSAALPDADPAPELEPVHPPEAVAKVEAPPAAPHHMEGQFSLAQISLNLYDESASNKASLEHASLFQFTLDDVQLKHHQDPSSGLEVEIDVKSFSATDTRRSRETYFRDIVPKMEHNGRQFMLNYTQSPEPERHALMVITVDSPKVIFSLDPLFALIRFVTAGLPPASESDKGSSAEPAVPTEAECDADAAAPSFSFRVNVIEPRILLLSSPERSDSQAIVLLMRQVVLSQQTVFALTMTQLGIFVWRMNAPNERQRLLSNLDVSLSMDSKMTSTGKITSMEVDVERVFVRLMRSDVELITAVVSNAIALSHESDEAAAPAEDANTKTIVSPSVLNKVTRPVEDNGQVLFTREELRIRCEGVQLMLISEVHTLPVLDLNVDPFKVTLTDWSADMRMHMELQLRLNNFNLSTSYWEPFIEPYTLVLRYERILTPPSSTFTVSSPKCLEVNVAALMLETTTTMLSYLDKDNRLPQDSRHLAPFLIRNRTGYVISLWSESSTPTPGRNTPHSLENGQDMPWSFSDWRSIRENVTEPGYNRLSVHLEDMPWDRVRHISVEREGEYVMALRPKLNKVSHRLLCEVKLVNNVKQITFQSTFRVDNRALIPFEVGLVEADGQVGDTVMRIEPGTGSSLPICAAYDKRLKVRPDPGLGYTWSSETVGWQDLMANASNTFTCASHDESEAPFQFQGFAIRDTQHASSRNYPRLTLALRAPVEIENLLPYDVHYRLFDKNLNLNWSSFLRRGAVSPVHVVALQHLLLLSIELQDSVYSPSEFAIIASDNPDDFQVEHVLPLADKSNLKLELRLHYLTFPDSGGAFKVQIYAPYIFLNLSHLPVTIKARPWAGHSKMVAGQEADSPSVEAHEHSLPFLLSRVRDHNNRFVLRVGDSSWSKPLSFDVIGSEVGVAIPSAQGDRELHLGLDVQDGLGKFKLSKVIKLTPRYIVHNTLPVGVQIAEASGSEPIRIGPGEQEPLLWLHVASPKKAVLACEDSQNWTAPFSIVNVGVVFLRVEHEDRPQSLCLVDVQVSGPAIFIRILDAKGRWPFVLRNETKQRVTFAQTSSLTASQRSARDMEAKRYVLEPRSKMKYAWDYPADTDKYIRLEINGSEHVINILEIGSLLPFRFAARGDAPAGVVSLDVRADNDIQTIVISDYTESKSNFKLTQDMTPSSTRELGFEAVNVDTSIVFSFRVELAGVGISLISSRVREIAYMTFRGLELSYSESQVTTAVNVICKWIQIDNQTVGSIFPIVLYPTVVPKDGKELDIHPTLQASVIRSKDDTHGVRHIKYASVLLQELTAELDEDFLYAVYDFVKSSSRMTEKQYESSMYIEHEHELVEPPVQSMSSDQIYIEILHLQPVALNLSFMSTSHEDLDDANSRTLFSYFFTVLTMVLGNVNEAPVRLNALVIENVRLSTTVLLHRMAYHYGQDFLFQVHRILGSADFLGNPVGLFNNVSSGVADIFYEPYYGLVMHGNRELGFGIARGASNFVKKTVFGVTDSVSKLTGSISKGFAAVTMDREFQNRWRMTHFRNKPKHALYGITVGANSLFTSVASGIEGLALRPLEGAEENGAAGFVQGMGRGLIGAVTKPAAGFFDMASSITEGLRNTTLVFEQNHIDRVRLPRFIASDHIIRRFSEREALGQMWLQSVDQGRLLTDEYVAHVNVNGPQGDIAIMLTETRILYIRMMRLKVLWEVLWSDLSTISLDNDGISLVLRGGVLGPFLTITEQSTRLWLFRQISGMSEGPSGTPLGSTASLGSGFQLGPILGSGLGRQGESNMYYAQNPHAAFYGGHTQASGSPSQRPQGNEYSSNHLVPYLNHSTPHIGNDSNDMNTGAAPALDAFYIQQAPNSFTVPLDVPDVSSYGQAGAPLGPGGLPMRGTPNMPGWGVSSRQSPAGGAHDAAPQEDADVLQQGGNGYPPSLGAGLPPMPGGGRSFSANMYRPDAAGRPMMMEDNARGARPLPKRRRTSPAPFEGVDAQSRFRSGSGPVGRASMLGRGMPPRRDMEGGHGDGLGELMPDASDSSAPSGDITSWFLGPEGGPARQHSFPMADPAAYYRSGLAPPPPGLRLDMPGLSAQAHTSMDAVPKGLPPLRSHGPNSDEEPLYVNAKQYQRIVKRRIARARMEEKRRQMFVMAIKQREEEKTGSPAHITDEWLSGLLALDEETKKPYLHESRHKHAMRRPRGPGGRFLTTEEIKKRDQELAEKAKQEAGSADAQESADAPPANEASASNEASAPQESTADHDAPSTADAGMALVLLAQCLGVAVLSVLLSALVRFWHARRAMPVMTPSLKVALHTLPMELQWRVLLHVAQPSPARLAPHDSLGRVLCLSRTTLHTLQAAAYCDVYIHGAETLHLFRRTLAVDAPHLGAHVRSLHLSSCGAASALALEQVFLAVPHLETLSVDASTAWRLCESQVGRLERAPRPKDVHLQWQVHPHTWTRLPQCLEFRLWSHARTLTVTSHRVR
ncbi:Vacuolar protein sorting-associated protein 13 [Malassezia caprae]|uniref:Vacuolar protein sorting-associated protein 13 n=1 Tax=Malassezia caprae TaxID=1381934 RepID=A0AAF0IYJ5_9BASI|nr:Vacuolar protein sorting-associated protein 13 [Malassezia caprae]